MSASDLDTAQQFRLVAEGALRTGDFAPLIPLLTADVECITPQHSVTGVDAMIEELGRARPPETFDVEFESGDWKELGKGRYSCELRLYFRSKVADDLSYSRDRSFELTIRDGKVARYDLRIAG
jgi:hypothetical protein